MKGRLATSAFLSSPRSFDWQTKREINAAPVVISGNTMRHGSQDRSSWSGLTLKPGNEETIRKSVSSRAWDEFLSAKRTIDPTYPARTETRRTTTAAASQVTVGNLQERIATAGSCDITFTSHKSVERNGRILNPNATSSDNVLKQSGFSNYRGRETVSVDCVSPVRRSRKANEISIERGQSQISTLPGPHRETSEPTWTRSEKVKPDFESHIAALPGTIKRTEEPLIPYKPLNKVERNTATSTEADHFLGPKIERGGPKTVITPEGDSYKSFQIYEPEPKGRQKIQPAANRILHETVKEAKYGRALRERPAFMKNLFQNTFKIE